MKYSIFYLKLCVFRLFLLSDLVILQKHEVFLQLFLKICCLEILIIIKYINYFALLCNMSRPRKTKVIHNEPDITYFKPRSVPLKELEEVELTLDELEAMRLSDIEKLNQIDSAKKMIVHQSTFQRTLSRAREKVTDALVNGKAIKICGGNYKMPGGDGTGPIGRGRGRGFGRGFQNAGPSGICVCPSCGHEEPHIRGQPCNQKNCPKCNSLMTRK
jgi:uncharacterized protein